MIKEVIIIEKLAYGLNLTLIGLGTVFFVLFLLQMVMKAQEMLFAKKTAKQTGAMMDLDVNSESQKVANEQAANYNDDMQANILAAITAAISIYIEGQQRSYKVVSVRKVWDKEASQAWTLTGQQNILSSRDSF
ncbi:MAG: OadG family protein [Bacillota bacterium]